MDARVKPGHDESSMASNATETSNDWLGSARANLVAWWLPHLAVVAALFLPVPVRTAIWTVALAWMGAACLVNARRCGRTHCRFTGPYYLAMILPVLVLGSGIVSVGLHGWIVLCAVILLGSKVIWWATERVWGKFS